MTEILIELSEEEFNDCYQLAPNHINPSAGWAARDGAGRLFDTHGDEFEYVRRQNPRCVWTWVDAGGDTTYLVSGLHVADRIGYLVSGTPAPDGYCLRVRLAALSNDLQGS